MTLGPPPATPRVLLVEDEVDLANAVAYALRREGFDVTHAATGTAALQHLRAERLPDVVVLDLMLPDLSGTEICRQIRGQAQTRRLPVVILSARGDEIDRVVGFELGADDYLVKPVSTRELVLRLRALLRRASPAAQPPADVVVVGRLSIDVDGHRCWLDERLLHLTAAEHRLLGRLVRRRGRVQTREALLDAVWGEHSDVSLRAVDTHIKRLRDKLGDAGAYIETLRGIGYRFAETVDGPESA